MDILAQCGRRCNVRRASPVQHLPALSDFQSFVAHINTIVCEESDSVQPHFGIPGSPMQGVKVGDFIRTEHNRLAVDDEGGLPQPERCLIRGWRSDQSQPRRLNSCTRLPPRWTISR